MASSVRGASATVIRVLPLILSLILPDHLLTVCAPMEVISPTPVSGAATLAGLPSPSRMLLRHTYTFLASGLARVQVRRWTVVLPQSTNGRQSADVTT